MTFHRFSQIKTVAIANVSIELSSSIEMLRVQNFMIHKKLKKHFFSDKKNPNSFVKIRVTYTAFVKYSALNPVCAFLTLLSFHALCALY